MAAAVAAPLLAEIPVCVRLPVVVLKIVLGILIGPHVLGLVQLDEFMVTMSKIGMAASLFMAGMEIDFKRIRGRPLSLALRGWGLSLVLGFAAACLLSIMPVVHAPIMIMLALTTTALGTLLPVLRDTGQLDTRFGQLFLAAGTVGEIGPIVTISLALSSEYSRWQEIALLLAFLSVVALAASVGLGARPPKALALLRRTMSSSTQLPVRLVLLTLAAFFVLAESFGLENILGAFAAGMVVGLATRGEEGKPMREKLDAVCFGWLMPFFFVGTGLKFNAGALVESLPTMLLIPVFLLLFLCVRGAPVLLYHNDLATKERLPFALFASVASLSLVLVIVELARARSMNPLIATALVAATMLSVLLFPLIGGVLLSRRVTQEPHRRVMMPDVQVHPSDATRSSTASS